MSPLPNQKKVNSGGSEADFQSVTVDLHWMQFCFWFSSQKVQERIKYHKVRRNGILSIM